jgi:hypothetical protein
MSRRAGLAFLDEEDGLPREVGSRELGHAEPRLQAGLPNQARIDLDPWDTPARLALSVAYGGESISGRRLGAP